MTGIPRVTFVQVCGPTSLELAFADGLRKRVNLRSLLKGRVFRPLLDPTYFRKVAVDPIGATVVWPNGADIAPETLYELPEERVPARRAAARRPPRRPRAR
jgi:hypothetical protein